MNKIGEKIKKGREIAGTNITFNNKILIQWLKHELGSHKCIYLVLDRFYFIQF